jgi:DNA repair protein RecN (Recombination protein N)
MLTSLRIKNLALVSDLTLEFQSGLTIITGETGAGKSILIGALNLLLGERADRNLIRAGCEACTVEAVFNTAALKAPIEPFLLEAGLEPCEDHQLILKRTLAISGVNRQFVNGSPANLSALKSLGDWLVDIHGPHDHQSLFHPARQLDILDALGNLEKLRLQFTESVRHIARLESEKTGLIVDEASYARQLDLLRFQSHEIASARLDPLEEDGLLQDHRRAGNAARLLQLAQTASGLLNDDENGLLTQAATLGRALQELIRIDPASGSLAELHGQAMLHLEELRPALAHYADQIDLDPERLQSLEERLNLVQSLKRKSGGTLEDVIRFGADSESKLESLEQRDVHLAHLNADLARLHVSALKTGRELSDQRRKVIPKLRKAAAAELANLGFKQSLFDATLVSLPDFPSAPAAASESGLDSIEFQFAPNPGEPPRPLRAIASSGEMARVMLALKTVLAVQDQVPVLVFDEVDANVGGETARIVGEKMLRISGNRQVFCVTHLAPVAAFAQTHFRVTKHVQQGRTTSEIRRLSQSERVDELARMLGGDSAAAKTLALSMIHTAAQP